MSCTLASVKLYSSSKLMYSTGAFSCTRNWCRSVANCESVGAVVRGKSCIYAIFIFLSAFFPMNQ